MINEESKFLYHKTKTWRLSSEVNSLNDEELKEFIHEFTDTVFIKGMLREIERVMNNPHDGKNNCGGVGHIVLISICSALDAIAHFYQSKACTEPFIKKFFPKKYQDHASDIRKILRNNAIHVWTLHHCIISGEKNDNNHLRKEKEILIISLYDFFDDFEIAVQNYRKELKKKKDLRDKFKNRYNDILKIVDPKKT